MINACCAYKWLSAKEISEKIGRHPTHTRRIIKRMLAEGILKAEFPEQPTAQDLLKRGLIEGEAPNYTISLGVAKASKQLPGYTK